MESKRDFGSCVVPVEGVLHFVAVVVGLVVGKNRWSR